MIKKKKSSITVVIPVRKGSKGIPSKNLYRLGKDTLLERTIKMAKACSLIDKIIVSSDSNEMLQLAGNLDVITHLRPSELALDHSSTIDVINDAIDSFKILDSFILLLQVTTPLRTLLDLKTFLEEFDEDDDVDSSVSLTSFDAPHPNKIQKIENGKVMSYLGKESMIARQLLPKVYALNGAFYIAHSSQLQIKKTFFTSKTKPFIMSKDKSLNLDHKWDLILLEALVKNKEVEIEEYDN